MMDAVLEATSLVLPDYTALVETTRMMLMESTQTELRFRDEGLFESAFARPHNLIAYSDGRATVFAVAASLAHGIATNHPLIDGNKRAGAISFAVTLLLNGKRLDVSQRAFEDMFLSVARGEAKEPDLERWAEDNAVPDARFVD